MSELFDTMGMLKSVNEIKLLLAEGGNPNESNGYSKTTALHFAAQSGAYEKIKLLLNSGAKPNIENADRVTAFQLFCEANTSFSMEQRKEIVKKTIPLVKKDILNIGLQRAVGCCDKEFVKMFLDAGADKNCLEIDCKTLFKDLTCSPKTDDEIIEMSEYLIEIGILPSQSDIEAFDFYDHKPVAEHLRKR